MSEETHEWLEQIFGAIYRKKKGNVDQRLQEAHDTLATEVEKEVKEVDFEFVGGLTTIQKDCIKAVIESIDTPHGWRMIASKMFNTERGNA